MLRLLIADDEKIVRETVSTFINWSSLGIEVVGSCKNGLEAYDAILDEYPDIVLTDIRMPKLSGIDLVKRITQQNTDIQFILLSGYNEFSYAKEAMKYGVKHYLLKPCNEQEIIEAVLEAAKDHDMSASSYDSLFKKISQLSNSLLLETDEEEHQLLIGDLKELLRSVKNTELLRSLISNLLLKPLKSSIAYTFSDITELLSFLSTLTTNQEICAELFPKLDLIYPVPKFREKQYKPFIAEILDFTQKHLHEPNLNLKWIVENHLYMSVDYVSRQFVIQTGTKFSTYLNTLRINKAKQLLMDCKDEKIYCVAEQVGCGNNPRYFSHLFKKYTNMTPKEYIQKIS